MVYVALLRGINVGGKNKVDMKQLKVAFEQLGMRSVTTYINSGNVIFIDDSHTPEELVKMLENIIETQFGFAVRVLLRDINNLKTIVKALPDALKNDDTMKCDVMFLWKEVSRPAVVNDLVIKPGIDDVRYVAGAVIWCVDRKNVNKSGLMKIIGTKLYKQITIRNVNTTRKLLERMTSI